MRSLKTTALLVGLGVIVTLYWLVGSGALGTGDQQPAGTIPGPAGGAHSSPTVGTIGSPGGGAPAGQQGARGAVPSQSQPISSQGQSDAGAEEAAPVRASNLPPLLIVNPGSIIPENVVTASGQGFEPGESVEVSADGQGIPAVGVLADKDGNFYGVPITVTNSTPIGSHTITALGRHSKRQAQATLAVAGSSPYANPSSYSGKGNSEVRFEGGGFRPGEIVSLHFDSLAVQPLQQVIAAPDGTVLVEGRVPLTTPGDHAFFLVGEQSNAPLRVPFSVVAFSPWMSPSEYAPIPQQLLGFIGHDFAPSEEVRIYRGKVGDKPVAVAHADENGEFRLDGAYEIPVDALGPIVFVAMGIHSLSVVSASVDVQPFNPGLELSVYAGRPGTTVSFKGAGYARGETITAYLGSPNGGRELTKFKVGEDGGFDGAGTFTIPPDTKPGSVVISALGEQSKVPREITFAVLPFTAWAGLTLYAGPPGTSFSFEGHDFLPGENVRIHLGDREAPVLGTVKADESGAFHGGGKYTVPDDAQGKIEFSVVGETSQATAAVTFTVTPEGDGAGQEASPAPDAGAGEQ